MYIYIYFFERLRLDVAVVLIWWFVCVKCFARLKHQASANQDSHVFFNFFNVIYSWVITEYAFPSFSSFILLISCLNKWNWMCNWKVIIFPAPIIFFEKKETGIVRVESKVIKKYRVKESSKFLLRCMRVNVHALKKCVTRTRQQIIYINSVAFTQTRF